MAMPHSYSAAQMMRLSELITKIRKKIDPYRQQQKCSSRTLLLRSI